MREERKRSRSTVVGRRLHPDDQTRGRVEVVVDVSSAVASPVSAVELSVHSAYHTAAALDFITLRFPVGRLIVNRIGKANYPLHVVSSLNDANTIRLVIDLFSTPLTIQHQLQIQLQGAAR